MQPNDPAYGGRRDAPAGPGRYTPAIVLIGVGVLFLLGNLNLVPSLNWFDFWPVILIILGAIKLAEVPNGGNLSSGMILFGIGAIFLAGNMHLLPFAVWDLWPLILIWIGVSLLFQRSRWPVFHDWQGWSGWAGPGVETGAAGAPAGGLNLTAVFSGGKRRIVTDDFRGGLISAVFGGFELDLRKCSMKTDSAVLKIDAVFGGVELKIPQDWYADVQGAGVFGGYSDETMHPPIGPGTKRLILKGGAVFGGVVVKN
ncbi:MAG TPA: DUF5668 domain-containing protein [Bryobacteraceae bacterium]|nr:DUF5668 domain-containing protein [Bryobacteraceae bacterium]